MFRWAGLLLACAGVAAPGSAASLPERWIEVYRPLSVSPESEQPEFVEIRARVLERASSMAGRLVIALDLSASAFAPAGFDVDGDGHAPRALEWGRPARATAGGRDSLAEAGRAELRSFLTRLDPGRVRVSLVTFAASVRVEHGFDRPEAIAEALDRLPMVQRGARTDLADAVRRSADVLGACAAPADPASRAHHGTILLVTDGFATAPVSPRLARRAALRAAADAARGCAKVVALSPGADPPSRLLRRLTNAGRGRVFRRELPDAWRSEIDGSTPLPVHRVWLTNRTAGTRGRAVRRFADGSFDGFLRVRAGANDLELRVELADRTFLRRSVRVRIPATESSHAGRPSLLDRLRVRTLEIELAKRARQGGSRLRTLEVEPAVALRPETDHPPF